LLLKKDAFERLAEAPVSELYQALMETPYKSFIKGKTPYELIEAVFNRYRHELKEMEKYASEGFVNVFFRNKEIFLRLKKWALVSGAEEENEPYFSLHKFVRGEGNEEFPAVFREAFEEMIKVKENPLKVAIALDIYRLKFLKDSATQTKSNLIETYYKIYSEVALKNMLYRMENFTRSSLIDNSSLSLSLLLISESFPDVTFVFSLRNIKDVEQFREFVSNSLAGGSADSAQYELSKILEKGRFMSVGIEVVFTYLKLLESEVSTLSTILTGKHSGMENKKILEKVAVGYE
jgi:hypothetical protein